MLSYQIPSSWMFSLPPPFVQPASCLASEFRSDGGSQCLSSFFFFFFLKLPLKVVCAAGVQVASSPLTVVHACHSHMPDIESVWPHSAHRPPPTQARLHLARRPFCKLRLTNRSICFKFTFTTFIVSYTSPLFDTINRVARTLSNHKNHL